jgi:hypothetical protein
VARAAETGRWSPLEEQEARVAAVRERVRREWRWFMGKGAVRQSIIDGHDVDGNGEGLAACADADAGEWADV